MKSLFLAIFLIIMVMPAVLSASSSDHSVVGKVQRLEICQSGSFSEIADTTLQDISKSGLQLTINQRQFVKSVLKKIKTFHDPKVDPSTAIVAKAWKKYRKGVLSVRGADCLLKIKWRLTGDLQDHIVREYGSLFHSLKIKLSEGSFDSASAFKLFNPVSRNGVEEVFVTLLFQELGFLAPDTFYTKVSVNGAAPREVLLQEDIDVSFLDRNSFSESVLFKGDESKGLARRDTVTQVINKELPKTASDRTISSGISQYLDEIYAASVQKSVEADERLKSTFFDPLVHPIFFSQKDFLEIERFSALAFGTTTEPGLSLDDSRYVYDKISRRIRPIYYDGHPSPELKHKTKNKQLPFFIKPETIIEILLSVQRVDASDFSNKLASRGWTMSVADVNARLVNIANNLETAIPFPIHDKKIVAKNLTDFVLLKRDREGANAKRTIVDVRQVVSGVYMESTGFDTVIIDKTNSKVTAYVESGEMVNAMHPFTSNPMLRIYGGSLSDWHFMVKYPANLKTLSRSSRGKLEYTGCVLFHDIKLTNLKIEVDNAPCEDAINLVRVNASELILNVNNSFADAIDADFSVVKEIKANVRNAGNDCLDFSFGKVSVTPILIGCGDKGVSVGEKTYAEIRNGLIKNTKVGVASKDGSVVKIDGAQILDTSVCLASYRKKLKFHGGVIASVDHSCNGADNFFQGM